MTSHDAATKAATNLRVIPSGEIEVQEDGVRYKERDGVILFTFGISDFQFADVGGPDTLEHLVQAGAPFSFEGTISWDDETLEEDDDPDEEDVAEQS
jgi:hypothetical protein